MRMNAHCLSANLAWQRRYFFSWIALILYGCAAFLLGDSGPLAISAQALFFVAAFSVILWPICAAFQAECGHSRSANRRPGK